jgi:hypothetical protein
VLLAFQTVMELRFGALRAGWGELRRRRLKRGIAELTVTQPDDAMITSCAQLRRAASGSGTLSVTSCTTVTGGSQRPLFACAVRLSPMTRSSKGRQALPLSLPKAREGPVSRSARCRHRALAPAVEDSLFR